MGILVIIIGAIIGDIIPVSLIILLIRLICKKKLSKGWCISTFLLSTFCSYSIGMLVLGKPVKLGIIDYLIHFTFIAIFLYDNEAPSYLDTEKEIKQKRELQNNKDTNA